MSGKSCPICRRPSTEAYAPFCTKRCADIDLQRWFSGAYSIPSSEAPDDAEAPDPDED